MSAFFGSDGSFVLQFAIIFLVILAVLTAVVLLARRFSGRGLTLSAKSTQRGRQPRLGIVDVYELDRQRQLILLRRDNVEHLLLVGGPNDVVIERNIQRGLRGAADPILRAESIPDALPEPRAEAAEIEVRRTEQPRFERDFQMPLVVPASVPGSSAPPPVTQPLGEAALGPDSMDEAGGDLPEPPRRGEAPPKRPLSRTTPPLINPRPDVASERARTEPSFAEAPAEPTTKPAPAPPPPPPVTSPAEPRAVDAGILSDMARQLEIALSRPASAVTPPPGVTRSIPPAPTPAPIPAAPPARSTPPVEPPASESRSGTDPMAAAMAASTPSAEAEISIDQASAVPAVDPMRESEAKPESAPTAKPFLPQPPTAAAPKPSVATSTAAPVQPAAPQPAAAPTSPAKPAAPPAEAASGGAKPGQAPNPFSVEEIEAEFARLLGRPADKG